MARMERFTVHCREHSVIVSMLQKSIRVCDTENALKAALELHVSLKSKGAVWNRLFTVAVEDVGMGYEAATWTLLRLYRQSDEGPKASLEALIQAVVFLCGCKKSRTMSYASVLGCWNSGVPNDDSFNLTTPSDTPKLSCEQGKKQLDHEALLNEFYSALMHLDSEDQASIDEMLWLYNLTLRVYQLQESEQRHVPEGSKFLKYEKLVTDASLFRKLFSKKSLAFHRKAVSVLWWIILSTLDDDDATLATIVISLAEANALGLGSEVLQLLMAVSVIRCHSSGSQLELRRKSWRLSEELHSENLNYDAVEAYLSSHPIIIQPHWVDKHTFRGRGVNTKPHFQRWAKDQGIDISGWSKEDYMHKVCEPMPERRRTLSDFLKTGITVTNKFNFFDEMEAEAIQLYLQKQEQLHLKRAAQHRAYIYQNQWLSRHGKMMKRERKPEVDDDGTAAKRFKYHAQRRTGYHKKHTYVSDKDGMIYKGPYAKNGKRLQTALARHLLLRRPLCDFTVQIPEQVEFKDGIYLCFPNISRVPPSEWIIEDTTTNNDTEKIRVPVRESMGIYQISGCMDRLTEDQKRQVLYHLLLRFCFCIGDTQLGNMLYNGVSVFGVDLEDNRGKTEILKPITTYEEFVRLLFTRSVKACYVKPLVATLSVHCKDFIVALERGSKICRGAVEFILDRLPKADLNDSKIYDRMRLCIDLLKKLQKAS